MEFDEKMQKVIIFFGVLLFPSAAGQNSIMVKKSTPEIRNFKGPFSDDKSPNLNYKNVPSLELIIDVKNFSGSQISSKEKKERKEKTRNRKDRSGKCIRQKNKFQKSQDDMFKQILRNREKAKLVRSKTIELLKNGLRILSAEENNTQVAVSSASRVNETLLKKILSAAVSTQNILLPPIENYKMPLGFRASEPKTLLSVNHTHAAVSERSLDKQQSKRQNKKQNQSFNKNYNFEYGLLFDFPDNKTSDPKKLYKDIHYETINVEKTIGILFKQLVIALKNLTSCTNYSCSDKENAYLEDPCQKWLNCRKILDGAFTKGNLSLPSCPCIYPSTIFYEDMIWDKNKKKYFRWRDASNEAERLDVYKPGAAYCIRSLLTKGSFSVSSQQCCYDKSLKLLTRGSGAGTLNFISPEISKKLHQSIDILPWKLCKGDFTRYNTARNVNNGNDCPENPREEEYELQIKLSKIF